MSVQETVPATTQMQFSLHPPHPNPFNPSTMICYQLPVVSNVNLAVYDVGGRKVADWVNGWREAGVHEIVFDGTGLASGIYIYQLSAGSFTSTGKMVLMK